MIFVSDTPKDKAALAAQQAKHAANNAGRAVEGAAEELVEKAGTSSNALLLQSTISAVAGLALGLLASRLAVKAQSAAVHEAAAKHTNVTLTTRGRKVG